MKIVDFLGNWGVHTARRNQNSMTLQWELCNRVEYTPGAGETGHAVRVNVVFADGSNTDFHLSKTSGGQPLELQVWEHQSAMNSSMPVSAKAFVTYTIAADQEGPQEGFVQGNCPI